MARVLGMEDDRADAPLTSVAFVQHVKALQTWIARAQHALDQVEAHLARVESLGATHASPEVRSLFPSEDGVADER